MHRSHLTRIIRTCVVGSVCSLLAVTVVAQTASDNTKTNTRDRAKGAVTADQQKENATDRSLTQKIRQSIVKDKSLSTYAHNVKIVAQDGRVTLKGPVGSDDEKRVVEAKATEIAGAGRVISEVTVAPPSTPTSSKVPKS